MSANRLHRAGLACCLAGVVALAGAAPAAATDVAVDAGQLRIVDKGSEANGLEVRPVGVGYDIFDDLTNLTAGAGCVPLSAHHVSCSGAIAGVGVAGGGGDDVIALPRVAVPVIVSGGDGSDLIEGGTGDDVLVGGAGEDTVLGDGGDDVIEGSEGDDVLQGDDGADRIAGGPDADIVQGQAGSGDALAGGAGPDLVEGGSGNDALSGGTGSDVLVTGSGTDTANPGGGSDQVFGTPSDSVSCGASDEVQTGAGAPPVGCARLPRNEPKPDIWPPPPDGTVAPSPSRAGAVPIDAPSLTAQAAYLTLPQPRGIFTGRVMHQGNARKITLRIPSDFDMPVRVRVRTYASNGRTLRTFRVNIRAKRWVTIDSGGPLADVRSAKVRCCVR
jgi:Ca2+-binding RTX toxin-like protein